MARTMAWGLVFTAAVALLSGFQSIDEPGQEAQTNLRIHYVEVVCDDVAAQCAAPERVHEQPIIRMYLEVDDIGKAVEEAEASGAVIAYPPTRQGDTGTWAIYVLGDVQVGLWQQ